MFSGLSLDQAPPFKAPLKFFLTAPIFAIIFGVFAISLSNIDIHSPNLIATIHILTLGYIIMIIFGALQQMLPVIAGAVIPKPILVSNITYIFLILGILFFSVGFITYKKLFLFLGAVFLLFAIAFFTFIALKELLKVKSKSNIVKGMIFSLSFFILAFLIGIHLIISHATTNISMNHYTFANLHYNYIFFGFLYLLITSITIQVVPMFWVADAYGKNEQKIAIYTPALLLVFYTVFTLYSINMVFIYKILMSGSIIYFAYLTVKKLRNRKRKLKDISVDFYNTSMYCLILGILYWIFTDILNLPLKTLGVFLGLGFIVSLINGMLYKIVPFLTWFHLSSQGFFNIPTMRDMIPMKKTKIQFNIHILSIILFLSYSFFDNKYLLLIASISFILSNLLFFINLLSAAKIYLKTKSN